MTRLTVHLLGGYRVELDGEPVYNFETDKARALLAYLVVEADRPHRRETLAALLWPDRPDDTARKNLRQALFRVKQALREADQALPFLFITPTDVQFNKASNYTLDVAELEAFSRAPARGRRILPEALCADFLPGFAVPDSEIFQAWVLNRQEYCHRLALEILDEQNAAFEGSGDYEQAVAAARLQLRIEPWLEEAHRRCMRGLALAGRRDEALRQYEACCRALEAELGVEPAAATTDLAGDIRAGKIRDERTRRRWDAETRGWVSPSPRRPVSPSPRPLLVAREDELGRLGSHLEAALAGETGVAFVSGDPGSGKTALLEAFVSAALARCPDLLVAGARCSPGGSLDPFAPLLKLAETLFGDPAAGIGWRPAAGDRQDRLQHASDLALRALAEHGLGLVDTLVPAASIARRANLCSQKTVTDRPAWREALRGGLENRPKPAGPPSQGVLFDQLICTLAAIAREQPLLLLFDDLQWVDAATAAFLAHAGRELSGAHLLILGAYRSTTVAAGRRDPASGEVTRHPLAAVINELRRLKGEILVDLDRADGRAFVEAYVDAEPNRLGAPFREALLAHTGGHALFTVETLRNMRARGEILKDEAGRWVARESLDWGALPARVEAAIAERIERLPELEHRILSCAAVQGEDFAGEVVAELAGKPAGEVLTWLSASLARQHQLVRPEGVQRLTGGQQSIYRFTHHLFQKYLYDQLDPVERARMHGTVAVSLDRQIAGDPVERDRQSARLAWHYEAGGFPLQAARALHDAGRQALRVSAFREALERFDHGLALLTDVALSAERSETERLLQIARLSPQRNLSGLGSSDVKGALDRAASALAGDDMGRPAFTILSGQAALLLAGARHEESLALFERLLDRATQCGDHVYMTFARLGLGAVHFAEGNLIESERNLEWVLGAPAAEWTAEIRAAAAFDPAPVALVLSATNQWCLGHLEAALSRCKQALAGAVTQGDTNGQAYGAAFGSLLLLLLRDEEALQALSEQCHRLSLQQGFVWWRSFADVFLGRRMVLAGEEAAGLERMQGGIFGWQRAGLAFGSATLGLVMADTCLLAAARRPPGGDGAGKGDSRAVLLASGLAAIEATIGPEKAWPSKVFPCELWRLRGVLLLARDGLAASADALECFHRAMGLASERGLLSLELRAAMSIVRLCERQGAGCAAELADVRACLRDLYDRFTEGFTFPDLREAAALIGGTRGS